MKHDSRKKETFIQLWIKQWGRLKIVHLKGDNEETYEPSPDTIYVDPSEIPSEAVNDLEEDN